MIFLIDIIVMPSTFLVAYFINDCSIFVNHKLCLYSMFFLLSRIKQLSFALLHNYEKRNLMFKLIIIYHKFRIYLSNPKPNKLMNCDKLSYATKHLLLLFL